MKEKENNKQMLSIPEVNARFMQVLSYYSYSGYKSSQEVEEISQAKISHVKSGRNKPGLDLITALLKKFPEVNARWLIVGEGKMLNTENDHTQSLPSETSDKLILENMRNKGVKDIQDRKILVLTEKVDKFMKELEEFKSSIKN
ncbi:hypothetical protein HHL23_09225 [Chryseobacterium sp. RP-3-3]|uniref:HTH cro/C1-type domain-containing protein n=1 Tax=Chryseobacterium antibioticum TaxID=2728847 RepID=A0A7Y0AMK6_9FLAO|nr:hypothetical protein [Chryseobacterium antibioticum]NML69980.1 hypothetical protein [Chryseobacterium antibioticum]